MKLTKILKKVFGSAKDELYTKLFSILSLVASEKDYLENLTTHSDAIHWHLNKVKIEDFELYLKQYFEIFIKDLRKKVSWDKITIAFDETFIPFYGKITNNWINGYTNKIKGAKGTYKFMVCSVIVKKKRYILGVMPMHNLQDTNKTVFEMLDLIKSKFRVETVLFDRGFCNKKLCRDMDKIDAKYLILSPKFANIKRFMKAKESEIVVETTINENKTKYNYSWRFVFGYDLFGYDWAFATNLKMTPENLVKLYKCRWGIETNFRVMDFADIKSKSKNIVTRCFFFFISAFLFNSWLEFNQKITFETFLDTLALSNKSLEEVLSNFKDAKKLHSVNIDENELRILSFEPKFNKYIFGICLEKLSI